jgi:hypothetical protein
LFLEFSDQGADVGFMRDRFGGFGVVDGELWFRFAESCEDSAATFQFPSTGIRRAVRPSLRITGQYLTTGFVSLAEFQVKFGQIHVPSEFSNSIQDPARLVDVAVPGQS